MSTYMSSQLRIEDVLAQARATRAQVVGNGIAQGLRFVATRVAGAVEHLRTAQKRRAAVAQLMAMDERMLQDIGLNRSLVPFVVAGSVSNKAADLFDGTAAVAAANANVEAVGRAA